MGLIGVIVVFGGIALYEGPRLLRDRLWRELAVFFGVWALGFVLSWLQTKDLPTRSWAEVLTPFGEYLWNGLEKLLPSWSH
ncbi:MAG: hypothetical protein GX986_09020 [Firmicutes bacterium]|nr:hypothetical protein [Bacillota bacterium]